MTVTYNGREIEIELSGLTLDHNDDPDVYIEKAYYVDTEVDLTEEEMDELQDCDQWGMWLEENRY